MDNATVTVWTGERFVARDKWLATAPIIREDPPGNGTAAAIPGNIGCVVADCGGTRVWLVREGERWLMFPRFAEGQWSAARFCVTVPRACTPDGRAVVRRAMRRMAR